MGTIATVKPARRWPAARTAILARCGMAGQVNVCGYVGKDAPVFAGEAGTQPESPAHDGPQWYAQITTPGVAVYDGAVCPGAGSTYRGKTIR